MLAHLQRVDDSPENAEEQRASERTDLLFGCLNWFFWRVRFGGLRSSLFKGLGFTFRRGRFGFFTFGSSRGAEEFVDAVVGSLGGGQGFFDGFA